MHSLCCGCGELPAGDPVPAARVTGVGVCGLSQVSSQLESTQQIVGVYFANQLSADVSRPKFIDALAAAVGAKIILMVRGGPPPAARASVAWC